MEILKTFLINELLQSQVQAKHLNKKHNTKKVISKLNADINKMSIVTQKETGSKLNS